MSQVVSSVPAVTATLVTLEDRMDFLPAMFPGCIQQGEAMVFDMLGRLSPDYDRGVWEFYQLSNGGFYMAPRTKAAGKMFWLQVAGNHFENYVTADAAGLIACMFALRAMSEITDDDAVNNNYYLLREFISYHPEASKIWAAIN